MSNSSFSETQVLDSEALAYLRESGGDYSVEGGYFRVKCTAVSESMLLSDPDDQSTMLLPRVLESAEAMTVLGFTPEAAAGIIMRFKRALLSNSNDTILQHIKATVRSAKDAAFEEDDWDGTMKTMGIDQSMRDRILNPEFSRLRMRETARSWVLDTLEAKVAFLESVNDVVLERKRNNPVSNQAPDVGKEKM